MLRQVFFVTLQVALTVIGMYYIWSIRPLAPTPVAFVLAFAGSYWVTWAILQIKDAPLHLKRIVRAIRRERY